MDNEVYSTSDYAKLFLLMLIPVYGFLYTVLLAFNKNIGRELSCLARGALIARVIFLIFVIVVFIVMFSTILPMLNNFMNNMGILRLF